MRRLFILWSLPVLRSFQCFSEYEFSWISNDGDEHVNMISISHFQAKVQSYVKNQTNRPPLKEAYFISKLSGASHDFLFDECPIAFSIAYLLIAQVSFFTEHQTIFDKFLRMATDTYNNLYPVLKESADRGWFYQDLLQQTNSLTQTVTSYQEPTQLDLVVFFDKADPMTSLLFHIIQYLPIDTRIFLYHPSDSELRTFEVLDNIQVKELGERVQSCAGLLHYLLNEESRNLIFLNDEGEQDYRKRSLSLPLVIQMLKVLNQPKMKPPSYLSFSKHLIPRSMNDPCSVLDDALLGYSKNSFFASKENVNMLKRDVVEEAFHACLSNCPMERVINRLFTDTFVLRCDDPSLPIALRLCIGDEHWRTDWRSTHLSPVYPRRAITQID